ncbi:helicase-related protein [Veillonella sp. YH-vei2232]|uniref:Helicase-related protein n=1 Tax=Veillonella absiana TaxID=3079305 RepID=A0ABU3ZAY9_9FIRM|nr:MULTISPECIES: helicase-related protein [unclassified Veillonella]MDV5064223.1 helicase-related protein [Veillonella sp. YH-vei2232]MDV5089085.1 helicase-related protein [Veillonella sp. YH-vei2233]
MKPPKILDNKKHRVVDELKEELNKGSKLSVISAYFTIYAYAELKKELSKIENMRFIFTEPTFVHKDQELIREYYIERNPEKKMSGNEFEIKLRNEMKQAAIAKECAQWLEKKAEIKSLRQANPAQPRLVYIENPEDNVSINGTVDFTSDGLGITPSNRLDSNMCLYGKDYTMSFLQTFNELWEDDTAVQDVKDKVLEQMRILYKENTPEFIYFVTLYNIFNNYLDELTEDNIVKSRTGFKETSIWNKLYKFQKDGVMGAIDKIEKYNGCIIADSVGLGKTFTALAVIKYYELRNDRVLVIVPKKLRENWTVYTMNDKRNIFSGDRFNYDVLNHTDLSRTSGYSGEINLATLNWSNYDLVVIDESHNFRNNPPVKGRITRYERFMNDIIKAGVKTKVLMLSATPVNNKMNDIKNQIAFITEGRNDAFASVGLDNLELILRKAQAVFNRWSELPDPERTTETFVNMMDLDYFKLLDTVTIARSRKHIEKYYNLEEIGKFPTRLTPENRYPIIDTKGEFPPIEEINRLIKKLTLCVYSPLGYVLPEKRAAYERKYDMTVSTNNSVFRQTDREQSLVGLMRVGILKRMESSINSFALTVENILYKIDKTLEAIEQSRLDYDAEMDISDIDIDDPEYENLMFGNNVKVLLQDMDLIKWRQDLLADKDKLETILLEAINVTPDRDAKLIELRSLIENKIKDPINPENRKVLIFTAFADTAKYLYKHLSEEFANKGIYSAIVTGSGDNHSTLPLPKELRRTIKMTEINTVLTLFSPISKECSKVYPEVNEYIDILIATDCISEGQNLQDCDYLVNYDIHWNPVRIIQRFGRIDRIGSQNNYIKLVNFWPTEDLDEYINLQQRVKGRMVLLDVSATGEENVIENNPSKEMKDLEYRKKQLKKLQNEVVDLEDISGAISITDLTFNDFKIELMEYMKTKRKALDEAPNGMYSVAKIDESIRDIVKPGVIFTLRQVKGKEQSKEQNPLFPYYMVYITDDGEVQLSFLHAKKILDYYKKLCSGKGEVLKELVEEFNKETNDGRRMEHYSDLLEASIENIIGKKQDIGVSSLFSKGGTTMQKSLFDGIEDFELITFLVLKS